MIGKLLLVASAAAEIGISPLVPTDHQHQWTSVPNENAREVLVDAAWNDTAEQDGLVLDLILIRHKSRSVGGPAVLDAVLAVDCKQRRIAFKEVYLHLSPIGDRVRATFEQPEFDTSLIQIFDSKDALIEATCGPLDAQTENQ